MEQGDKLIGDLIIDSNFDEATNRKEEKCNESARGLGHSLTNVSGMNYLLSKLGWGLIIFGLNGNNIWWRFYSKEYPYN